MHAQSWADEAEGTFTCDRPEILHINRAVTLELHISHAQFRAHHKILINIAHVCRKVVTIFLCIRLEAPTKRILLKDATVHAVWQAHAATNLICSSVNKQPTEAIIRPALTYTALHRPAVVLV